MSKPTPTHHAAWRVINGQLVDESAELVSNTGAPAPAIEHDPDPLAVTPPERVGGPGIPVLPIDATTQPPKRGRNTPSKSPKE